MRTLDRNKTKFYYCLHHEKTKIYDDNHNFTGEYSPEYAEPIMIRGNISPASGTTEIAQFGNDISYDKTIALQGTDWEIDESTVLIVDEDAPPQYGQIFFGNGQDTDFKIENDVLRIYEVWVGGQLTDDYTLVGNTIKFTTAPELKAVIHILYQAVIPRYDYIVVRKAVSLNHTVLAIKRVE